MFNLTKAVQLRIDKLVGSLKSEEQLVEILRKKFTKKEYKVFIAMESDVSVSEIAKEISVEVDRVKEIYKAACKKLNQEKIKKELVTFD